MTYLIQINDNLTMYFSDTHFSAYRKKPTISIYDKEQNCETKIASFNSEETFKFFLKTLGVNN